MRGFLERRYMLGSGPKEGKCTVKIRETEIILQYYWRVGWMSCRASWERPLGRRPDGKPPISRQI